ncbi:MAG: glycosyltransferase [Mediterranea sp.]|jgi:uncharacterized protein (TIGR00661 family)|nr:glycosyltransferase [Mediterranea sp.]
MKILFIIQGEGRGHLTQAIALHKKLLREGHQIVGVLVGKSPSRRLPDFFYRKIAADVHTFDSPNFLPTARNKQANLPGSILYNLLRLHKYVQSIRYINRVIRETEADVVVNFYELLSGLTYAFFRPKAEMVCIAHQYVFLHPDFKFPAEANPCLPALLKFFTRLTAIGANKKLALSFRSMREITKDRLVVVPPLLRDEVLNLQSKSGDFLLGYVVNSGFGKEVITWHNRHPDVRLRFYWDNKKAAEHTPIDERLSFYQLNDERFLHDMARAKAYATTAGFESVCEAMYLGKPVLMVPAHIEQACNAYDAAKTGAGAVSSTFDLDRLLELSETYKPNPYFKHWVDRADWIILREFEPELLFREHLLSTCVPFEGSYSHT